MQQKIKTLASGYLNDVIGLRRHLHQNPELSFKEFKTAEFVWNQLDAIGITDKQKLAGTGIVALIKGRNADKKTVALRADMDALPIIEANEVPYKSQNIGVMHACGHDAHTASLLGAARILNELKDDFEGTIKLGAMPHLNVDPVLIASHMIVALQQIVSRHANPTMPSVLSFGKVIANGATNVIPNEVYLEGTFRTLDEKWRTGGTRPNFKIGYISCGRYGWNSGF
ncbi:MAG: M20/M25/M40 family metallo-hydrolase [Bacteroidetes bacterium]|nr:M20/M25/M40 family metallo-hydrolase [Bacteroidota bacterium]